ncbi:MAG: hypothetical protein WCA77_10060 [Thermoplasmata archaeon]
MSSERELGSVVPAQPVCVLPSRVTSSFRKIAGVLHRIHAFRSPSIQIGSRAEYLAWESRARSFLRELGRDPSSLERVDATFNYRANRVLIFNLPDPAQELSIGETISHEILHAVLEQMGERWAARSLDQIVKPVGRPDRVGGL